MVDLKKIYQQLDKEYQLSDSDSPNVKAIQRACLPLVMRAMQLYDEQLNEAQKSPS